MVQFVLSDSLVVVQVLPQLLLSSYLTLSLFEVLLQLYQVVWISDLIESLLKLGSLPEQVSDCFVSVY